MSIEVITITLGDEYDVELLKILEEVLCECNAVKQDQSVGIAGSQEIESSSYRIADDVILVEAETYVGLSISGERGLVEFLASRIISRRAGT